MPFIGYKYNILIWYLKLCNHNWLNRASQIYRSGPILRVVGETKKKLYFFISSYSRQLTQEKKKKKQLNTVILVRPQTLLRPQTHTE